MAKKQLNFEQAMERLEQIVSQLELGQAPLDQSLALFEEGTQLMRQCSALLDQAEQKVSLLRVDSEGQPDQIPFDTEE